MEVGAALELQANGHFRYQLDYGAVSEQGEGDWTFDGTIVRLTSNPMPKLPSFELARDDPAPKGELAMKRSSRRASGRAIRLDAVATDAVSGEKGLVTTDSGRPRLLRRPHACRPSIRSCLSTAPSAGHFALQPGSRPPSPPALPCERSRPCGFRSPAARSRLGRACASALRYGDLLCPHSALKRRAGEE